MAKEPKNPGAGEQPDSAAFDAAFFRDINPADLPTRARRTEDQPEVTPAQAWQEAAPDVAAPQTSKPAQTDIRLEEVNFEVKNYNSHRGIVTLVVTGDNPYLPAGLVYKISFVMLRPLLIDYKHVGDIENPLIKTGDGLDGITVFIKPNGEIAIKPNKETIDIEEVQFINPKNDVGHGTVKFYNVSKRGGYIIPDNSTKDMYVDGSAVDALGGTLVVGQGLSYRVVHGPKGPRAVFLQREEIRPKFEPRGQNPKAITANAKP